MYRQPARRIQPNAVPASVPPGDWIHRTACITCSNCTGSGDRHGPGLLHAAGLLRAGPDGLCATGCLRSECKAPSGMHGPPPHAGFLQSSFSRIQYGQPVAAVTTPNTKPLAVDIIISPSSHVPTNKVSDLVALAGKVLEPFQIFKTGALGSMPNQGVGRCSRIFNQPGDAPRLLRRPLRGRPDGHSGHDGSSRGWAIQ